MAQSGHAFKIQEGDQHDEVRGGWERVFSEGGAQLLSDGDEEEDSSLSYSQKFGKTTRILMLPEGHFLGGINSKIKKHSQDIRTVSA